MLLLLTQGSLSLNTPCPALPWLHSPHRKIADPQNVSLLTFLLVIDPAARPDCSSHVKVYVVFAPKVKMGLRQWFPDEAELGCELCYCIGSVQGTCGYVWCWCCGVADLLQMLLPLHLPLQVRGGAS